MQTEGQTLHDLYAFAQHSLTHYYYCCCCCCCCCQRAV